MRYVFYFKKGSYGFETFLAFQRYGQGPLPPPAGHSSLHAAAASVVFAAWRQASMVPIAAIQCFPADFL